MVNTKDDINHEVEETMIANFLQFALEDDEYYHPEDMNSIDCSHILLALSLLRMKSPLYFVLTQEHLSQ